MAELKGFFKTPCFYYGVISLVVIGLLYFGIQRFPKTFIPVSANYLKTNQAVLLSPTIDTQDSKEGVLFFNQGQTTTLWAPELKIIQSDCLSALSTPRVLSTKVLGSLFGQGPQLRTEIIEYTAEKGDTVKSIATKFDISQDTIAWTNSISKTSTIKAGQVLVILPTSGLVHIIKPGDTLSTIAKTYKAVAEEILDTNELNNESDIYIGDIVIVPNGIMPKKAPVYPETYLADNYFIFPTAGTITQRLHWYNGVDIANQCGAIVSAAAAGQVLKAGYSSVDGGGNEVKILHEGGVVTLYAHLMEIDVQPGQQVGVGEKIGLMGGKPGMAGAGRSTGCHLHFTVIGAKNPFRNLSLGYQLKYASE